MLLAYTLRDSFARGDRVYDMGVGSYESKRHFQTRLIPILRYSHYPPQVAADASAAAEALVAKPSIAGASRSTVR